MNEPIVLRVADVQTVTGDASAITFAVPPEHKAAFGYLPGQHVAVVREEDGVEVRRSYSLFEAPSADKLSIAVKHLPNGQFSRHVAEGLRVGDEMAVLPPAGRFAVEPDPALGRHCAALAAGSGITPILSILRALLEEERRTRCTLVYGNRTTATVMFLEELHDLKDRFMNRFQIVHVFSREAQPAPLLEGRVDAAKLVTLFASVLPPKTVDEWFLCGPFAMIEEARSTLRAYGIPSAQIHRELFHVDDASSTDVRYLPAARPEEADQRATTVTIRLGGRTTTFPIESTGERVLDAALRARRDAPFACRGGVCGTCRCRVVEGSVEMAHTYALEDDEIENGIVLACQARPTSERLVLDFDSG